MVQISASPCLTRRDLNRLFLAYDDSFLGYIESGDFVFTLRNFHLFKSAGPYYVWGLSKYLLSPLHQCLPRLPSPLYRCAFLCSPPLQCHALLYTDHTMNRHTFASLSHSCRGVSSIYNTEQNLAKAIPWQVRPGACSVTSEPLKILQPIAWRWQSMMTISAPESILRVAIITTGLSS